MEHKKKQEQETKETTQQEAKGAGEAVNGDEVEAKEDGFVHRQLSLHIVKATTQYDLNQVI